MAPPLKGTIHTHTLADGTRAFHLRVRFRGERVRVVLHELDGCTCGCGGSWDAPVTFHAQRLGARVVGRGYAGRRVVCEILGRTGVLASELCAMRIGHVRLHDPTAPASASPTPRPRPASARSR